jgi:hypothetical protein
METIRESIVRLQFDATGAREPRRGANLPGAKRSITHATLFVTHSSIDTSA